MINLIWTYENFEKEKNKNYTEDLFRSSTQNHNASLVIESGFKIFLFLKKYEADYLEETNE